MNHMEVWAAAYLGDGMSGRPIADRLHEDVRDWLNEGRG